jgi:ABC-type nitrate/sulfonate/bicarbonate transport system substrate-binding protein
MKTINIGGVPEHFNLAWYLTLKAGAYKKEGINLRWKDYFGGTGQMCNALRNKDIDIAVILTEGIVKYIIAGNPSKIVQVFVKSPLTWGIHVANNSPYKTIENLKGAKAAISRFGSGSHLMAYINAQNNAWNLKTDLNFEIVKNLEGAVQNLTNGSADYFLWEKFTTKPLVDNCIFRRLGDCTSPWPCFVIAVREDFLKEHTDNLKTILNIINTTTSQFKDIPSIDITIANRYNQQLNDVRQWLKLTHWSQSNIKKETIELVQNQLLALDIIPEKREYSDLVTAL